jgi:hypothetical protein
MNEPEAQFGFRQMPLKQYQIPRELLIDVPKVHANWVQVGGSNEEVSLIFGNKMDLLVSENQESEMTAIPQVVVHLTIPQAFAFAQVLNTTLGQLKQFIESMTGNPEATNVPH